MFNYGSFKLVFMMLFMAQLNAQHLEPINYKKPMEYSYLSENDILWSKRIWRIIDLFEINNQILFSNIKPYQQVDSLEHSYTSLSDFIVSKVFSGVISAYSVGDIGDDDSFTNKLTQDEIIGLFFDTHVEPNSKRILNITRYEIKEDWYFDKTRSEMNVRVIGICPIAEVYDDYGIIKGYRRLFWIHYPQVRGVLAQYYAENLSSQTIELSIDDIFVQRLFTSYIVKESNMYDTYISEYLSQEELFSESKWIEQKIKLYEEKFWDY